MVMCVTSHLGHGPHCSCRNHDCLSCLNSHSLQITVVATLVCLLRQCMIDSGTYSICQSSKGQSDRLQCVVWCDTIHAAVVIQQQLLQKLDTQHSMWRRVTASLAAAGFIKPCYSLVRQLWSSSKTSCRQQTTNKRTDDM